MTGEYTNIFAARITLGTTATCHKPSCAHFDVHVALVQYTCECYLLIFHVPTRKTPE